MEPRRALLIVDLQNDFTDPGGALSVKGGPEIVPGINSLIESKFKQSDYYSLCAFTRDRHPQDHCSFARQHAGAKPFTTVEFNGNSLNVWPPHCVEGTPGFEFFPDLQVPQAASISKPVLFIDKGRMREVESFSAFGSRPLEDTGLSRLLRQSNIEEVHVVGLALDYCVLATALDASENYKTTVLIDLTRAVNTANVSNVIGKLQQRAIRVVSSEELL